MLNANSIKALLPRVTSCVAFQGFDWPIADVFFAPQKLYVCRNTNHQNVK